MLGYSRGGRYALACAALIPERLTAVGVLSAVTSPDMPGFAHAFDLGQEWFDWTSLPFVYAVWAVRDGADLGAVEEALVEAKRRGCTHIGETPPLPKNMVT